MGAPKIRTDGQFFTAGFNCAGLICAARLDWPKAFVRISVIHASQTHQTLNKVFLQ